MPTDAEPAWPNRAEGGLGLSVPLNNLNCSFQQTKYLATISRAQMSSLDAPTNTRLENSRMAQAAVLASAALYSALHCRTSGH